MPNYHQDFISRARQLAKHQWDVAVELQAMQKIWNAQDLGNTLSPGEGENMGYDKDKVGAVVFASNDAVAAVVLGPGHSTNYTNLF
jgi:hypothetical protein